MTFQPLLHPILIALIYIPLISFCVLQIRKVSFETHDSSKSTWVRRVLIVVCLFLITVGPSISEPQEKTTLTNLDVIFVIDTTSSMSAEDGSSSSDSTMETRLATAKNDIVTLSYLLPPAKYSTILFNSSAYLQLPLTEDVTILRRYVDTITPEISRYSTGTSLMTPFSTISQTIDNAIDAFPRDRVVLIFMSDGDDNSEYHDYSDYYGFSNDIYAGGVIGYGTTDGAHMKEYSADVSSTMNLQYVLNGKTENVQNMQSNVEPAYIMDPTTGQEAISKLQDESLKSIAKNIGIPYVHRSAEQSIRNLANKIHADTWNESASAHPQLITKLFIWPFSLLVGILILIEFVSRVIRTSSKGVK
ncbi:MAG: VWA domain-containing protein [Candidatus Ancillula sp.]|jgi:Ca-activated chloride channel family protein|nr:VWA domain-containing protein [Candidatus Ancillula sp.]